MLFKTLRCLVGYDYYEIEIFVNVNEVLLSNWVLSLELSNLCALIMRHEIFNA